MLETLLPLLGKSLESTEIKQLLTDYGIAYPKKTTCTANHSTVKGKFAKDGALLYFGMGGHSQYLKPIPAKAKGSYIGIFTMIEMTKKYAHPMPFGVTYGATPEQLTAIFGAPKVVDFMGKTTTWRKNLNDKHEFMVCDNLYTDGSSLRSITVAFIWEDE